MTSRLVLKHQTPTRWRFFVDSSVPLNWALLQRDLEDAFPSHQWCLRLNQSTCLIVISSRSSLSINQDYSFKFVYSAVVDQLNHQGCQLSTIPLSKVEVIKPSQNRVWLELRSFLYPVVNAFSASLSMGCLLLASVAFVFGLVGLYLPLFPGLWIMLLATFLFETALDLRRPFVA